MPSQPPPSTEPAPTAVNQQPQPQIYSAVPPHQMQQISQGPVMGFPGNPPYSFNQMIPYSYITAAELRMRGLNEQFIAQMEEKRPYLQRFIEQHQEMRKRRSIGGAVGAVNNNLEPVLTCLLLASTMVFSRHRSPSLLECSPQTPWPTRFPILT